MKNRVTKIRLTPEEAEAKRKQDQQQQQELTPKQKEQLAYKTGNRRTRRRIAKRNGFFKDRSGEAWRKSNEMIRTDEDQSKKM